MCVCVFTGLGGGSGFADVLQDGIPLLVLSIFLFLGTTRLWTEGPESHVTGQRNKRTRRLVTGEQSILSGCLFVKHLSRPTLLFVLEA